MRKPTLRVRLYAPNQPDFYRLRAYVSKGKAVQRKYILSDISAPGSELIKFVPNGSLLPGATAPDWLQKEIQAFYKTALEVAQAYDTAGVLQVARSKEMTDKTRALLQSRKQTAPEVEPIAERG